MELSESSSEVAFMMETSDSVEISESRGMGSSGSWESD